jgi:hypothetical protein
MRNGYTVLFIYFGRTTEGLILVRQVLYNLSHVSSPFVLVIFQTAFCFYAQASLDYDPPIYVSHSAGMTGTPRPVFTS